MSPLDSPLARPQRLPVVSLILAAAAAAVMPLESLASWLAYDRAAVEAGELWRLLTCQFTHWSWEHYFWDAAAMIGMGFVLERDDRRRLLVCLGMSAILIPAAVHWALPDMATYRGLSGIASAEFVLLAVILFRKCRAEGEHVWTAACLAMFAGFALKTAFELATGGTLFVDPAEAAMVPVPLAHVVGGAVGAACGLLHAGFIPALPLPPVLPRSSVASTSGPPGAAHSTSCTSFHFRKGKDRCGLGRFLA